MAYILLIFPLVLFSIYLFLHKAQEKSGWAFIVPGFFFLLLFVYFLFDSGQISRFIVKIGNQNYSISSNALEEIITKNLDTLGKAIANVYESFYIREYYDCSKESNRVQYKQDKSGPYIELKLKFKAVENSLLVYPGDGLIYSPDEDHQEYADGFYKMRINSIKDLEELKKKYQELKIEIRYFRKE